MPGVSVAIATFNGAEHLGEQLDSILAQSVPVDEIVLADDGSTDGSVELVRSRLRTVGGPELVVVDGTPPRSIAGNFSRALGRARHDVVLLSDQDDRWRPDRVARTLEAFATNPDALALHGDARLVDSEGYDIGGLFEALEVPPATRADIQAGRGFPHLLRRNIATGATMAVRRELVEIALPVPPAWIHDEWLALVAAAVGRLTLIDAPLIEYRQHGANEIGATSLGVIGKLRRMVEPRAERNARLLARATSLADRLPLVPGVTPARIKEVERKLEHERMRSFLPPYRLARVVPVLRELRTGRYRDFGRGAADAVRDLLQPR